MRRTVVSVALIFVGPTSVFAQTQAVTDSTFTDTINPKRFHYSALIIPSALVAYGVVGIESEQIKGWNSNIRDEVTEDIDEKVTLDDFSQWAPAVSVFTLDAAGTKAKNTLKDRAVIYLTSFVITNSVVFGLKSLTRIERPDGTAKNSFPSGHTANAFMGAEMLYQEYKDQSIWYGIAGYTVAAGTGLFRIYNNRHWLTNVAAGAGIGILGTKAAYWINPWLNRKILGRSGEKDISTSSIIPMYDGTHIGIGFVKTF